MKAGEAKKPSSHKTYTHNKRWMKIQNKSTFRTSEENHLTDTDLAIVHSNVFEEHLKYLIIKTSNIINILMLMFIITKQR